MKTVSVPTTIARHATRRKPQNPSLWVNVMVTYLVRKDCSLNGPGTSRQIRGLADHDRGKGLIVIPGYDWCKRGFKAPRSQLVLTVR
jgi:hypothetical protein